MAVAPQNLPLQPLTYEQYLAEPETSQRYDIVDGVRMMTNPTRRHQRLLRKIARLLEDYEEASGKGQAIVSPCDVLIRRQPLRTRQPDVLFISNERLAQCGAETDPAPLSPAPELVVEILSPSDTRAVLADKLADYQSVNVQECWIVNPNMRTVEVLILTPNGAETATIYGGAENRRSLIQSIIFSDLTAEAATIFTE